MQDEMKTTECREMTEQEKEMANLRWELDNVISSNEMLKDTIIRLAMRLMGVT